MQDKVNIIYTDIPLAFEKNFDRLSRYTDRLKDAAYESLEEEAVLIAALRVHHAE